MFVQAFIIRVAGLEIDGTGLKYQRQGAGSMLIKYAFERADKERCQAFLEAAPDALPLYHKFGCHRAAEMRTSIKTGDHPRENCTPRLS
jgi:GNAT superfamily N-acetyltransferase